MSAVQEFRVQLLDIVAGQRLPAFDFLFEGWHVPDIAFGVIAHPSRHLRPGQGGRIGQLLFEAGNLLIANDLQLVFRQRGITENLAEQFEHLRQRFTTRLDAEGRFAGAAGRNDAGPVCVQLVLDLLPVHRAGAAQHQSRKDLGGRYESLEAVDIAVAKRQSQVDRLTPGFLGKQRNVQSAAERRSRRPRLDVLRRHVERFADGESFAALVVADHFSQFRRGRNRDALGFFGRQEHSRGAVVLSQIVLRNAIDTFDRHLFQTVAIQEQQPPVSLSRPFAELNGDSARIGDGQFPLLEPVPFRAFDLFFRHAVVADRLNDLQQCRQHVLGIVPRGSLPP